MVISSTSGGSTRTRASQPYNSFKQYIWGGLGDQEDLMFGWNMTYMNFNNDAYPDLIIGTPWYDSTASDDVGTVYIFFGKSGSGFDNINISQADIIISGDGLGDKFGWDVADAGDVNNDGTNDLIVGAPGAKTNRGHAYIFHGGTIPSGTYTAKNVADRILDSEKLGVNAGGYFGSAVAGVGDINNDGYDDVLVGAPSAAQALLIYMNINTSTSPLPPGIVSYWKFNEGNGTIANDSIDTNHGNISGATWVDGISGSALSFDGTDDYVDCGNNSNLDITTNDFTVALWAKSFGFTSGGTILSKQSWFEFNGPGYFIAYPNNPPSIYVGVYDTKRHTIRTPLESTFDWTHITMVKDGSQIKVYINGMATGIGESTTDVTGSLSNTKNLLIGKNEYNNGFFNGLIDEIAIYNRSLTSEEIQQLMELNNEGSVIIHGAKNSGFGSAITGIGDINGDDYPDMLISAPNLDGGHVALFHGKEPFKRSESINLAPIILTGKNHGDKFGYSIANAGDVDNDGIQDIIIGAPGGNYANLYYGSTLNLPLLVPDLWV